MVFNTQQGRARAGQHRCGGAGSAAQQEQLNDTAVVPLKVLPVHLSGGFLAQLKARQQAASFISRTLGMSAWPLVF